MEIKSSITIAFLLILILARPSFSQGGSNKVDLNNEVVYEIDYRGPETHWYVPPPDRSGGSPSIHHESVIAPHKLKGPRSHHSVGNGKSIHG